MSIWTDHPNSTENPQGYWAHWNVAFFGSFGLIWAGLIGVIHAFFPFVFPFYTTTRVIRSFRGVVGSNRHGPELKRELPDDWRFGG